MTETDNDNINCVTIVLSMRICIEKLQKQLQRNIDEWQKLVDEGERVIDQLKEIKNKYDEGEEHGD